MRLKLAIRKLTELGICLTAMTTLILAGCGGGGGGSAATVPSAIVPSLTVTTYPVAVSGAALSASMTVQNSSGGQFSYFTSASGVLTQSSYSDKSGKKIRMYYDKNQHLTRIVDEVSKIFLKITSFSSTRTDYNYYSATGVWQGGWAVLQNPNGTFSTASIISEPRVRNIAGSFNLATVSGVAAASGVVAGIPSIYVLTAADTTGLGTLLAIPNSALLSGDPTKFASLSISDQIGEWLVPSANAITLPNTSQMQQLVGGMAGGAYLAAAGGLGAVALGATAPVIVATAVVAGGAYAIGQTYKTFVNQSLDSINTDAQNTFALGQDPAPSLLQKLQDYFSNNTLPTTAAPSVNAVTETVASTQSVSITPLVAVTTPPPVTASTSMIGDATDAAGLGYAATGDYASSGDVLALAVSGNGTTITGTATGALAGTLSGTFTGTSASAAITGSTGGVSDNYLGSAGTLFVDDITPSTTNVTSAPDSVTYEAVGTNLSNLASIGFNSTDSSGVSTSSTWTNSNNGWTSTSGNTVNIDFPSDNFMTFSPRLFPTGTTAGTHNVSMTLTDNTGATATRTFRNTFTPTITPAAPASTSPPAAGTWCDPTARCATATVTSITCTRTNQGINPTTPSAYIHNEFDISANGTVIIYPIKSANSLALPSGEIHVDFNVGIPFVDSIYGNILPVRSSTPTSPSSYSTTSVLGFDAGTRFPSSPAPININWHITPFSPSYYGGMQNVGFTGQGPLVPQGVFAGDLISSVPTDFQLKISITSTNILTFHFPITCN